MNMCMRSNKVYSHRHRQGRSSQNRENQVFDGMKGTDLGAQQHAMLGQTEMKVV